MSDTLQQLERLKNVVSEKSKIEAEISKLQLQLRSLQQQEQYLTNLVLTKTKPQDQLLHRQRQQTLLCQKLKLLSNQQLQFN